MKKTKGITFLFITSLIQLFFIVISYFILYGIARLFHEPYVRLNSSEGMDFYYEMLIYLSFFVVICVFFTNIFQEFVESEIPTTLLHSSWLILIIWFTRYDLYQRPYDYGLILLCIVLTIPVRIFNRTTFHLL